MMFKLNLRFVFALVAVLIYSVHSESLYQMNEESVDSSNGADYEVVVVGKRLRDVVANPRLESPGLTASLSTVNDSDIQKQGARTLVQSLNYTPGSFTETRGKKVKQFVSFRGQKYPYPTYAVEGAWQNEFQELPYFFPTGDIERVEITRSSAALLSSLTSLSGVINVILKKFDKPTTQYDIEYGSFESYYGHILHGSKEETRIGPLSYSVGLTANHTDGPDGFNAAEDITNFYGYAGLAPTKKLSVDMRVFHLQGKRDTRIFEYPSTTDWTKVKAANPDASLDPFRATFFNLKTFYEFNEKASLELIGYYTDRKSQFNNMKYYTKKDSLRYWNSTSGRFIAIDSLTAVQPVTIDQDWEWGINATQALSIVKNNILRVGGLYNHWTAPNGKRYYSGSHCETETWLAVVVDEHRIGKLSLDAGARLAKTYNYEYTLRKDAYDNNNS